MSLKWKRNPALDMETAKTTDGKYTIVRTYNDVSVLWFGDECLNRCSSGSHKKNRQLAETHHKDRAIA